MNYDIITIFNYDIINIFEPSKTRQVSHSRKFLLVLQDSRTGHLGGLNAKIFVFGAKVQILKIGDVSDEVSHEVSNDVISLLYKAWPATSHPKSVIFQSFGVKNLIFESFTFAYK